MGSCPGRINRPGHILPEKQAIATRPGCGYAIQGPGPRPEPLAGPAVAAWHATCKPASLPTPRGQRQDLGTGRTTGAGRAWDDAMKKIEAVIKPFKLDEVKEALHEVG